MELPIFSGDEAFGWIVKMDHCFTVNGVREGEMTEMVLLAMEGKALNLFLWWEDQTPFPT